MTKLTKKLWLNTGIPIILVVITFIVYLTYMLGLYSSLLFKLLGSVIFALVFLIALLGLRGHEYYTVMNPDRDDEYVEHYIKWTMNRRIPGNPEIFIICIGVMSTPMSIAIDYNSWLIGVMVVVVGIVEIFSLYKAINCLNKLLDSYKESVEKKEQINKEITKYIAIHVVSYIVLITVIFIIV